MSREAAGILPVDKPEGPTSHDIVAAARRALGTRRIGHTGTLDPFASGLLLLCVGWATRLAEYLTDLPKTYRATARLGTVTDTADRTGEALESSDRWRTLDEREITAAFAAQTGEIWQIPPAYSAKRIGGERAYERARRGETVELKSVPVVVHRIEILEVALPLVRFEVECSSGTYVRAIARDIGDALGVGAHLTELRRTRVGHHDVRDALPIDRLGDPESVRRAWIRPLDAIDHLPSVDVEEPEARTLQAGGTVGAPSGLPAGVAVAVARLGDLLAIAEVAGDRLKPRKVFPRD